MQISNIGFCGTKKIAPQKIYNHPQRQYYTSGRKNYHNPQKQSYSHKKATNSPNRLIIWLSAFGMIFNCLKTQATNSDIEQQTNSKQPESIYQEGELPSDAIKQEIEMDAEYSANEVEIPDMSTWGPKINLSEEQKYSVKKFIQNWEKNSHRYYSVEEETGVPAPIVAAIHWRESSGNFNTNLHNGTKLGTEISNGKTFYTWEDSAADAMLNYAQPEKIKKDDIQTWLDFTERYNGMGYRNYHDTTSPYTYAGTIDYKSGKYLSDGVYDPNAVDQQPGTVILLHTLKLYIEGESYIAYVYG